MPLWEVKVFVTVEADTAEEAIEKVTSAVMSVDLSEEEPDIQGVEVGFNQGEEPIEVKEKD